MSYRKTIIGFLGRKGSGKSTAAKWCHDTYGSVNMPFAAGVKELCKRVLPHVPEEAWYGNQDQKELPRDELGGLSGRTVMQNMGNEAREVIGERVWIDAAFRVIDRTNYPIYTIDDVRYVNECAAIRNCGGYVIKLYNESLPNDDDHPSEAQTDLVPPDLISHEIRHHDYGGVLEQLQLFLEGRGLIPLGHVS